MKYKYLRQVLESGQFTSTDFNGGKFVQILEQQIRQFTKARYAVAVSSGTMALYAVILAMDMKKSRIAFPSLTFRATKNSILATDNKPVPTDITLDNLTIRQDVKNADCIIPVHLYGHVAHIKELKEHGIPIIEDCAQSLGSTYDGKHTGTFGDAGCFSFYPSKIISAGEGGMVITNKRSIAEKCKLIRNHGNDSIWGLNLRMSEIHASIAVEHMENISQILDTKKNNIKILKEKFHFLGQFEPRPKEVRNNILYTTWTNSRKSMLKKYPTARVYYPYTLGAGKNADLASKHVISFPTNYLESNCK